MVKFEVNQRVWVQGVVKILDPKDSYDVAIHFDGDFLEERWFSSKEIKTLPQQPKPPAPVRLFGKTIFDLQNCMEIGDISCHKHEYTIVIQIMRGERADSVYFEFETQEEATAAREEIEKKVLEAKGIDNGKDADLVVKGYCFRHLTANPFWGAPPAWVK